MIAAASCCISLTTLGLTRAMSRSVAQVLAQIMEADVGQSAALEQLFESAIDVAGDERHALLTAEDQVMRPL
jgi:hypothetical protein